MYLCYDIKGIQRFIFSIPKLKCVIGGSCLIDEFDHQTHSADQDPEIERIFSGGGRGAFFCAGQPAADRLAERLIQAAHASGLDIRLGLDAKLTEATQHADRLYPCWPEPADPEQPLAGEPCSMSALWPVPAGRAQDCPRGVHPLVWLRVQKAREDRLGQRILFRLRENGLIPNTLVDYDLCFFRNVTADADADRDEQAEATAGRAALGDRNRWAIIAMDGNDMGRQFRALDDAEKSVDETRNWLKQMSESLENCTHRAFLSALGKTMAEWVSDIDQEDGERDLEDSLIDDADGQPGNRLVLPFRPLILGGDDVLLLCHSAYAMSFVKHMAAAFRQNSRELGGESLWLATGGELTISAGVLYCKVTFPLHLAIPYAESLLGSAKGKYRIGSGSGKPTPAAVDWDAITDTLVDTPAARRNRELRFLDPDLGDAEVCLTRRPYLLEPDSEAPDLPALEELAGKLKELPPTIRARILPALQRPWSERVEFLASVAKHRPVLKELLWEADDVPAPGWQLTDDKRSRTTGIPDALMLLEEQRRMANPADPSESR